jgi:rare lipoprotein A
MDRKDPAINPVSTIILLFDPRGVPRPAGFSGPARVERSKTLCLTMILACFRSGRAKKSRWKGSETESRHRSEPIFASPPRKNTKAHYERTSLVRRKWLVLTISALPKGNRRPAVAVRLSKSRFRNAVPIALGLLLGACATRGEIPPDNTQAQVPGQTRISGPPASAEMPSPPLAGSFLVANERPLRKPAGHPSFVQKGLASWYGPSHQGRRTASGERFDGRRLTAAHRSLPLHTVVRVTNLDNRKSVTVRVNDRGPYCRRRVIDLSDQAARQIDMKKAGIAHVRLEVFDSDQGDS